MKRNFRHRLLLPIILGISFLCFTVTAILIGRSYFVDDLFRWRYVRVTNAAVNPPIGDSFGWLLTTGRGGFTLETYWVHNSWQLKDLKSDMMWHTLTGPVYALAPPEWIHWGFYYRRRGSDVQFSFPAWIPLIGSALLFYLALRSWRRKRTSSDVCVTCGYDLRAHSSGDKCPECGEKKQSKEITK